MKKEDVLYAKQVYEKIIITQVFNPQEINKAYKRLLGKKEDELINFRKARHFLFNYFYFKRYLEEFPELENEVVEKVEVEKEVEVDNEVEKEVNDVEKISEDTSEETIDLQNILNKIVEYEKLKEEVQDTNEKRSLSMKINHLKKQLNNE